MPHRMSITLGHELYERLRSESTRTGMPMTVLIRRAIDLEYGTRLTVKQRLALLDRGPTSRG